MKKLLLIALGLVLSVGWIPAYAETGDIQPKEGIVINLPNNNDWARGLSNIGTGAVVTSILQGMQMSQPLQLACMIGVSIGKESVDVNFGKPQEEGKDGFWDWSDVGLLLVGWALQSLITNAADR
jgi:hypothetical protein